MGSQSSYERSPAEEMIPTSLGNNQKAVGSCSENDQIATPDYVKKESLLEMIRRPPTPRGTMIETSFVMGIVTIALISNCLWRMVDRR